MLQSTLAHRASTCGEPDRHDLSAWDAASPLPDKPGAWVWLVLAVLIALNAVLALII
jgi:hypothetical protein